MSRVTDSVFKLSIVASVLLASVIASGSVAHYYLVYLPQRDAQLDRERRAERERAEAERQAAEFKADQERRAAIQRQSEEKATREAESVARQARYQSCLGRASDNFNAAWAAACKRELTTCISAVQGLGPKALADCNEHYNSTACSLHRVIGTDINSEFDNARNRCLEENKAGLK